MWIKTWILVELKQLLYVFSQQTLVTSWRAALFLRWRPALADTAFFGLACSGCFWFCCAGSFKGGSCPDARNAAARARVNRPGSSPAFNMTLFSFFMSARFCSKTENSADTKSWCVNPATKRPNHEEGKKGIRNLISTQIEYQGTKCMKIKVRKQKRHIYVLYSIISSNFCRVDQQSTCINFIYFLLHITKWLSL